MSQYLQNIRNVFDTVNEKAHILSGQTQLHYYAYFVFFACASTNIRLQYLTGIFKRIWIQSIETLQNARAKFHQF